MDRDKVRQIADLLQRAAIRQRVVSYQRLHALFQRNQPLDYRYRTLEEAARTLCDPAIADFGCLMALASGLPGDDFFLRFRRLRPKEFEAVMGFASAGRSTTRKRILAESERARVYEYAALVQRHADPCECAASASFAPPPEEQSCLCGEAHSIWEPARSTQ